jgi:hypothetical protein
MFRKLIVCAAVCVMNGSLFAQELPKPGPEHEKLKEYVGSWDAEMDMNGQKSKCSATYKSICDGMWLQSDFQGDLGGMKFQGHGLDGYNMITKKYVGTWVDSMSSSPMTFEGTYDEKTKTTTMAGESLGPDGQPQKFKTTTVHKDKDHFTFKMFMVTSGGDENLAFTIEYTRKK